MFGESELPYLLLQRPNNTVTLRNRNITAGPFGARRFCFFVLLALMCTFRPVAIAATTFNGSLTDPEGRAVPGASIRLQRRADSTQRQATTDPQGRFSVSGMDGGEYRLTAESPGFAGLSRTILVQSEGQQVEDLQFSNVASQNESIHCDRFCF